MTIDILYKQDKGKCWICELQIIKGGRKSIGMQNVLKASRDHIVFNENKTIRLAHVLCNIMRGHRANVPSSEFKFKMRRMVRLTGKYQQCVKKILRGD